MKPINLFASFIFCLFFFYARVASCQSPDSLDAHPNVLGFELGIKLNKSKDLKESFKNGKEITYDYIGAEKTWQGFKINSLEIQTNKGKIVSVTFQFNADTTIAQTLEHLYGEGKGSDTAKEWNGKKIGVSFVQAISIKPVDGKMKMIPSDISVSYYDIAMMSETF